MLPHKIYPWAGILPYAMPVHLTHSSRHRCMLCVALSLYFGGDCHPLGLASSTLARVDKQEGRIAYLRDESWRNESQANNTR